MNYAQVLASHFPENSFGGQCGTFCHRLVQFFPVGNFLTQKIASLHRFGIPLLSLDSFKVGDVVLQKYPIYGHLSVINAITGTKLQLTESNYYLNGRVSHKRQIDTSDPRILGVFRGALTYPIPPRVIEVKLVQNGSPWGLMTQYEADILKRVQEASGGRIGINIDSDYVNLTPPYTQTGYPTGRTGIDLGWYEQNILPHKKNYHVVAFLTGKDPQVGNTFGWASPGQEVQIFADETETITSASFGTLPVFVESFIHEILGHCMKQVDGLPDLTHEYMDNLKQPAGVFDLPGLMATYDWDKIINFLNQ